jgi:hypothetical protein
VGVVRQIQDLVTRGRAFAILGNHELNLLRGERKDGNDWYWGEGTARDQKFQPFKTAAPCEREEFVRFMGALPLALERDDLRVVHAAWHAESIERMRTVSEADDLSSLFDDWERGLRQTERFAEIALECERDLRSWGHALHDASSEPPLLAGIGRLDELHQVGNPLRVLTSGVERLAAAPFFSSGKWRFAERVRWWDDYDDPTPVIIGHYWRRFHSVDRGAFGKGDPDLFEGYGATSWHGKRANVFCVDYSAGGRYEERRSGASSGSSTKLAALRWPELELQVDTGERIATG